MSRKEQYFIAKNTLNQEEIGTSGVPDPLTVNDVVVNDDLTVQDLICTGSCLINAPLTATQVSSASFIGGIVNVNTAVLANSLTVPVANFANIAVSTKSTLHEVLCDSILCNDIFVDNVLDVDDLIVRATVPATSTTTGAVQVAGGVGVAGALHATATFTGELTASCTTVSTSTNTGALRVAGGAGIGGTLYAGALNSAQLELTNTTLSTSTTTGALRVAGGAGIAGNVHAGLLFSGELNLSSLTAASSTSTGALRVAGGAGIAGDLYAGSLNTNNLITGGELVVSNSTASTSSITGALRCAGGAGIAGNIVSGGYIQSPIFYAGTTGYRFSASNSSGLEFNASAVRMLLTNTEIARYSSSGFRIGSSGNDIRIVRCGNSGSTAIVNVGSSGFMSVSIGATLPSAAYFVICTANTGWASAHFVCNAYDLTTTGFKISYYNVGPQNSQAQIYWILIQV